MTKMISKAAVNALIDAKIDGLNALLENPRCRGMDRKVVAAQIGALVRVKTDLRFIINVETATGPTDVDLRKLAIDPSGHPGGIVERN